MKSSPVLIVGNQAAQVQATTAAPVIPFTAPGDLPGTKYATERKLDSVWTLRYLQPEPGRIEVLSYNRTTDFGYQHETRLPRLKAVVTANGTLTAVLLAPYAPGEYWATDETATERLCVINPRGVFTYGK